MTPELQLIAISVLFLGFAYFWAYPRIAHPTGLGIMWRDGVISMAAMMMGALFFAGKQVSFDLVIIETNWFVFQLVTLVVLETPLFIWFAIKNDLEF